MGIKFAVPLLHRVVITILICGGTTVLISVPPSQLTSEPVCSTGVSYSTLHPGYKDKNLCSAPALNPLCSTFWNGWEVVKDWRKFEIPFVIWMTKIIDHTFERCPWYSMFILCNFRILHWLSGSQCFKWISHYREQIGARSAFWRPDHNVDLS